MFACGPSLMCDAQTQYCYHFVGVVVLLDAGGNYSCQTLPACDAATACDCLASSSSLVTCSCVDTGGDVTDTCTCHTCATH
jgi:hypothetical protein